MTPPDPPADPLASPPRWCPECGYVMAGLPAVGRCPECGWGYEESTVVLYGRAVESVEGARPESTPEWAVLGSVAVGCLIAATVSLATDGSAVAVAAAAAVGVAGAVFAYAWQRRLAPSAPREQVRLTPAGYARRRGFGPVQVEPWTADVELTFRFDSAAPGPRDSPGRPADLSGGPAALVIRRGGRGYRFAATSSVRAMVRFDAGWEDVDRLARRTTAWRDGA